MFKDQNFILRYSNCWEDVNFLLTCLGNQDGRNLLSVCSGGDNSLSLLTLNPDQIVVVDINPLQLYLLELKMTAIKELDYENCLAFLGYTPSANRKKTYLSLAKYLTYDASNYWESRLSSIRIGLIHAGYLERNLRIFGKLFRALIHNSQACKKLFKQMSFSERANFIEGQWRSRRWNMLFLIAFNNFSLKLIGPDSNFFEFNDESVREHLQNRIISLLVDANCETNYMLHYALFGNYGNLIPHYMKKENFEIIKIRLDRVKMINGFVEKATDFNILFSGFNLSNIFDYNTDLEMSNISKELASIGHKGSKYIYWNIINKRLLSDFSSSLYLNSIDTSIDTSISDRGLVYDRAIMDLLS